jgi:endonuclease G, mitochondrial
MNSLSSIQRPLLNSIAFQAQTSSAQSEVPAGDTFVSSNGEVAQYGATKLLQSAALAAKPYYDEAKDQADVAKYYAGISADTTPADAYKELSSLVSRTHRERFSFDPEKRLFPWIDLRPSLRLQSIYSNDTIKPDSPIKSNSIRDFQVKERVKVKGRERADGTLGPDRLANRKMNFAEAAKSWGKILAEGPTDAVQIAQRIAAVEGHKFYNAEHSVPQYFFDHDKVPKGDMHHLFSCEHDANSDRSCRPYSEVERLPENRGLQGWRPKKINQYEPDAGKGQVARATLYFLLRYPGEIGDRAGEYTKKDIPTLLKWHKENPVSLYEKHRNQAIAEVQGNRNPLIDHPEWADKIDFVAGLGEYGRKAEISGASGLPI